MKNPERENWFGVSAFLKKTGFSRSKHFFIQMNSIMNRAMGSDHGAHSTLLGLRDPNRFHDQLLREAAFEEEIEQNGVEGAGRSLSFGCIGLYPQTFQLQPVFLHASGDIDS